MHTKDATYGEHSAAAIDRVWRNTVTVEKSDRAETPLEAMVAWAEEIGFEDGDALLALAERLRESDLLFSEDGMLVGSRIVSAMRAQAKLYQRDKWAAGNRLRLLSDRVHGALAELGLL